MVLEAKRRRIVSFEGKRLADFGQLFFCSRQRIGQIIRLWAPR
jgi:hypothetical protein